MSKQKVSDSPQRKMIFNKKKKKNRLNDYSGSEWAKASISVFKFDGTIPDKRKEHGAAFPFTLAKHFILTYTKEGNLIFDPFVGVGTTTDAAMLLGRKSIGIDINKKFIRLAKKGPDSIDMKHSESFLDRVTNEQVHKPQIYCDDSLNMLKYVEPKSVDLILTSPPYGNLLRLIRPKFADKLLFIDKSNGQKISKELKNPQVYSDLDEDLGNMEYQNYLEKIGKIFDLTYRVAKKNTYAVWVVKDYRDIKNGIPYMNLHGDIINIATQNKWILWDIVIWDQTDRRPLVVLGYPSRNFYANIGHSFILIFKKKYVS